MKKRYSIGVIISVAAVACAITYVITVTVSTNMFNRLIGGVTQREEIYSKIQEVDSYVRSAAYYDIDEQALNNGIISGYVTGLRDADAAYLSESQAKKKQQIESGTMVSVGLEVSREESGYIKVDKIYANSPAESLNIHVGDIITEVNGDNVLEIGSEAAISNIDGDENTNVRITIQRNGEPTTLTVTRRFFTIQSVTSAVVSGYGYIRIEAFNSMTGDQFVSELQKLQAQGVLGYVIDVRNSTGTFDCLSDMLSRFISTQLIANAKYKDGTIAKFIETTGNVENNDKLVVLVDGNTVGAAELFAISLRDFASAKIVGSQTAGKGTVTETKNLTDGTALVITRSEVLPAVSSTLSGGIKADFAVELTGDYDFAPIELVSSDPQISKAFEVLESL